MGGIEEQKKQVPPSGERGVGLSISTGIVADHTGQLTVQSEYGEGSTFRLTFPQVVVERAAA